MKLLDRLGLAIFSIIILVLSIVLILIGSNIIEPSIFSVLITKLITSEKYTYALYGICTFLALLSIKCLFFAGNKDLSEENNEEQGIELQNENGNLLITQTTLINLVDGVVMEIPNVETADTKVIIDKENNVSINVIINVKKGVVIKEVSSKLQNKIKQAVKESTDLELKYVNIQVVNVRNDEVAEELEEESGTIELEKE